MMPCPLCGCRPCHCAPVPSPAPKESGGVGAASIAAHIEAIAEAGRGLGARRDAILSRLAAAGYVDAYSKNSDVQVFCRSDAGQFSFIRLPVLSAGLSLEGSLSMVEVAEYVLDGVAAAPHPLEARRDALVATLLVAGFEERPAISERIRRYVYCNDYWIMVPNGHAVGSEEDFERALGIAEAALKRLTSTVDSPLPGRWGHRWDRQHSTPLPNGLAGIGARGQEPVAPGPTVDDLRADLVRRDVLLAQMEADRDYERRRANEAIAQLHDAQRDLKAITAALDADTERSPAWDDNDQPIPLPRRVEVALMPEGPGKTWIERKIMGHLDSYGVPTGRNGITLTLASRVAVAAEGWRDHSPEGGKKVNG